MKKYLTGILMSLIFLFGLNEIAGCGKLVPLQEDFMPVQNSGMVQRISAERPDYGGFEAFYLYLGEIPATVAVHPRNGNFFRTLKCQSTIRVLSAINIPLLEKNSKGEYFHFNFVRTSYRYFIYTLRRLLI